MSEVRTLTGVSAGDTNGHYVSLRRHYVSLHSKRSVYLGGMCDCFILKHISIVAEIAISIVKDSPKSTFVLC